MNKKKRIQELEEQLGQTQAELNRVQSLETNLRYFLDSFGGPDAWKSKHALSTLNDAIRSKQLELEQLNKQAESTVANAKQLASQHVNQANQYVKKLREEKDQLENELYPLRNELLESQAGLYDYKNPAGDSIKFGIALKTLQKDIAAMVRANHAVESASATAVPTTASGLSKLAKDTARMAIRAFNAEAENIIKSLTPRNYETSLNKLSRSVEAIERLGAQSEIRIAPAYFELRARELKLTADYLAAKQQEKEIEKERRAELREQERAERELEAERERLRKEKQHYLNVLKVIEAAGDVEEAQKMKDQLVIIEKGINDIENRVANIRAGYVYVISNIGSFGSGVVKIGMTRRLDPMERVKELSDASVPFNFDVHTLFFSEDAVGVETALHRKFANQRLNLVNLRREFFRVTPAEVRNALAEIEGSLLEFVEQPEAEQWIESEQIRNANENKPSQTPTK